MKYIGLILFLIPFIGFGYDLKQLRLEYYQAVTDEKAASELFDKLSNKDLSDPILLAYCGSAEALKAKHAWNPYHKISYLKSGLKKLGAAVSKNPESLEIRFLRFSLEHYLPSFLGYSKHLDSDRKKMVQLIQEKNLGTVDKTLMTNIVSFMKESGRCKAIEIAILDKAVKNG